MKLKLLITLTIIVLFWHCDFPEKNATYYMTEEQKASVKYQLDDTVNLITYNDTILLIVNEDKSEIVFINDILVTYYSEQRVVTLKSSDTTQRINIAFTMNMAGDRYHLIFNFENLENLASPYVFNLDIYDPFELTNPSTVREFIGLKKINNYTYQDV